MGQKVVANRDMQYDKMLHVRRGQVFELRGHRNDGGLLKHRHVTPVKLTAAELKKLPASGERRFLETWQRDRSGEMDTVSPAVHLRQRRESAGQRMIKVGA